MCRSFFSLLILILLSQTVFGGNPQPKKKTKKKAAKTEAPQPFFRSVAIQGDILNPFISKLSAPGSFSFESSVDVNIKNKWFPVWESGYASVNHTAVNDAQFITHGLFNRIGINISLLKNTDNTLPIKSILYMGLRFGFSSFNYDLKNFTTTDDYWKTSQKIDVLNNHAFAKWGEIVAGVRVNVIKNFTMGWSLRIKVGLSSGNSTYPPWYIPGYGQKDGSTFGFTYTLGYTLPIK
jgi:hypothetical protein